MDETSTPKINVDEILDSVADEDEAVQRLREAGLPEDLARYYAGISFGGLKPGPINLPE